MEHTLHELISDKHVTLNKFQGMSLNFRAMSAVEVDRLKQDGKNITLDSLDAGAFYFSKYLCECCAPPRQQQLSV